jgi:broad specificity phosphatase PhoE
MHVILLRHATRSPLHPADGGLSEAGRRQAADLVDRLNPSGPLLHPTVLIASPKRRAQETLAPLSSYCGIQINLNENVDERRDAETGLQFQARVRAWVKETVSKYGTNDVLFVCSHLDWLEEVLRVAPSNLTALEIERPFAPCEARAFEIRDGIWYTSP